MDAHNEADSRGGAENDMTSKTAHFPMMIPGAPPAAGTARVEAPWDGSTIATVDLANVNAVETALATAAGLAKDRDARIPLPDRLDILARAAGIMTERREALAVESAREGGKPLVDSLIEVDRAIDGVKLCIETMRTQAGREIPMNINKASAGRIAYTRHEPVGVVLAFSAFNHPLNLIVHQIAPALATGCPSIVKPAAATPLSCMRFVSILHEAGLPQEWAQALVTDSHETANRLVTDPSIAFFTFIGSGAVGWKLRSSLAPGAHCALEHGGVAPVLFAADADLDDAVPLLAKGGLYHAGQVCVSVQRVFAERSIARELAERLRDAASTMTVGDPTSADSDIGPLIREAEVTRVHEWVREAIDAGGEALIGAEPIGTRAYAPTILFDPPADVRASTHEIFGPVICVYPVDDLDEGIARANSLPYAFQASIFTRSIDNALRASSRLAAAAVMVNDQTAFRVDWMPFGGYRDSGLGMGGIPNTIADMQIERLTVFRSPELVR
jgi:acyl-CoA reductase-like NAD-dependent aldehyde dehydrogenase